MKLLFSEARPEYGNYIFPYAVWAFPESGEKPHDFFAAGFLPSSPKLDRFYLCRHVRVALADFKLSSENRRILRKGAGLTMQTLTRARFNDTPERREFFKRYADARFGSGKMTDERLDRVLNSKLTSHVLEFRDGEKEIGFVTLYLDEPRMAYYYYAFYDLEYASRNLGLFMMTSAVQMFAERKVEHLYLGTCYSVNALYKTQFAGFEFFNGLKWSDNLKELKTLIERQSSEVSEHLWENENFRKKFYPEEAAHYAAKSRFHG